MWHLSLAEAWERALANRKLAHEGGLSLTDTAVRVVEQKQAGW